MASTGAPSQDITGQPSASSSATGATASSSGAPGSSSSEVPQLKNILTHVDQLEEQTKAKDAEIEKLRKELKKTAEKAEKFSKHTSERMQAVYKALAEQWIDPMPPEDDKADEKQREDWTKAKESCKSGLQNLIKNSDENSGVWRLMVAASAQHARQVHDLEQMRVENNELKLKLDGRFGEQASRVGQKRPADEQLDRMHEVREHSEETVNMWDQFAADVGQMW